MATSGQLFLQKVSIVDVWLGFKCLCEHNFIFNIFYKNLVYENLKSLEKFLRFYLKKNKILSVSIKDKSCNNPDSLQLY